MKAMENKREITLRFRVNTKENELINDRAVGDFSSWLRNLALNQKRKPKPKPINPELIYHLNKIGVNLMSYAEELRHS